MENSLLKTVGEIVDDKNALLLQKLIEGDIKHAIEEKRRRGKAKVGKPARLRVRNDGIKLGEIVACRCWRLIDTKIHSVWNDCEWVPGEPMKGNPHIWGEEFHFQGVYAWANWDRAVRNAEFLHAVSITRRHSPIVIGRVELWGEVFKHENGWRAEYGKIRSLDALLKNMAWTGVPEIVKLKYLTKE